MLDRRKSIRSRSYLGGRIAFNQRSSTMDCVVRNFSDAGAKLVFTNTVTVPDRFEVHIPRKGGTLQAQMIWRRADEAGVVFVEAEPQGSVVPLEAMRRIRTLEAEKAALRRRIADLTAAD